MDAQAARAPMTVASTFSDRQPGGLTTVIQRLTAETHERSSWTWVVRLDRAKGGATDYWTVDPEARRPGPAAEIRTVAPIVRASIVLRGVGSTIFRPGGATLAPSLYGAIMRPSLRRQLPDRARHLHWVGTGIELLGFELLRQAHRAGTPFTVCPALHPGEWGDAEIDARLYRAADGVLVLTRSEGEHVERMGVPAERISLVPLGPTTRPGGHGARFRRLHGIAEDALLVTFMARRSKHKGLLAVQEAARLLRDRGRDFTLAVAGPPGDVEGVAPSPWVLDLGLCDEPTKADLLAATDVFCVPSTSESLGIVYLDAWSMGVPIVAGRPPAVLELVREGVDGFCVAQEAEAVASAVDRLLGDRELRARIGEAGRRKQRAWFTWEHCAAEHVAAFGRAAAVSGVDRW